MIYVYVINKDGEPLMPTNRCGHVRWLLQNNKAKVYNTNPFTIQLLEEKLNKVQKLYLGVDSGRTNIGISVITEKAIPVFSASVETRNKDIPQLMFQRKVFRSKHRQTTRRKKKQRRAKTNGTIKSEQFQRKLPQCETPITLKYIKNKESRYSNRKRKDGWLTPTVNQLLLTHQNLINKIRKFLPITDIVLELNSFWFNELDVISSKNLLKGYGSLEDRVYKTQEGKCIFCKEKIEHHHHIIPKHKQGSDTVSNIVGLCEYHHSLIHTSPSWKDKVQNIVQGRYKKFRALSVLNQIIPFLVKHLQKDYRLHLTDGYMTSSIRKKYGIEKDHYIDAYCIAFSQLNIDKVVLPKKIYKIKQYRRHDRQVVHQENCHRKYYLDGKVVATNRHRAFEQNSLSLDEYILQGGRADNLKVKDHLPIKKRIDRILPGSKWFVNNKVRTLKGSQGIYKGNPQYLIFEDGVKALYSKCKLLKQNAGLVFV